MTAALALSLSDLHKIDGEPRLCDLTIGERLGMARPRKCRELIRKNAYELQQHGEIVRRVGDKISGNGRVRDVDEFYLNEAQTLLICMFARTPKAADCGCCAAPRSRR